jgi:hypothetical protein
MNENNVMKVITALGIAYLIYLFFRFRQTGTVSQISPCKVPACRPNVSKCCCSLLIGAEPSIDLASDYLPCAKPYVPAVAKTVLPARRQAPITLVPFARPQTTTPAQPVAQPIAPPCYPSTVKSPAQTCYCFVNYGGFQGNCTCGGCHKSNGFGEFGQVGGFRKPISSPLPSCLRNLGGACQ